MLTERGPSIGVSRFIGRGPERALLEDQLRRSRLVTVVGPGGIGKTRLALEVVTTWVDHAVTLCELAGVDLGASLPEILTTAAGLELDGASSPLDAFVAAVRNHPRLVVLDNCEHVLPTLQPMVRTLLARCPGLRVLATSRSPLGVDGEHLVTVGPLDARTDAAALFVDRALAVCPGTATGALPHDEVSRLCATLDGIPLAIELAAPRLRSMTLRELTERLESHRIRLRDPNRADPRHRTLASVIDWSLQLLPGALQHFGTDLAVFAGGFDLDAAHAVAGRAIADCESIDAVHELVEHSLLQARTVGASTTYSMLEPVRQELLQRCRPGDRAALTQRHAAFFLAFAEEAHAGLAGADQLVWLDRLEQHHDDLRAALGTTVDVTDTTALAGVGIGLAGALSWFWRIRGHVHEGHRWLERALSTEPHVPGALRVRASNGSGLLAHFLFDLDRARHRFSEARALAERCADRSGAGWAEHGLGRVALEERSADALTHFRRSIEHFHDANDERGAAYSTYFLAFARFRDGDVDGAAPLFSAAHATLDEVGDTWGLATLYLMWSNLPTATGDTTTAADLQRRGLRCAAQLASPTIVGRALLNLAATAARADRHDLVVTIHRAVSDLADARWPIARTRTLADKHLALARSELAEHAVREAWSAGASATLAAAAEVGQRAAHALLVRGPITSHVPTPLEHLTARERQVLEAVATGAASKQIGHRLGISTRTVEVHLSRIYAKLGVSNRVEATLLHVQHLADAPTRR